MNILDLLILLSLLAGIVHGFTTGLIRQVASIVGMALAFVLSVQLMGTVGQLASNSLGLSENIGPLVGFVLVFLAVQVAVFALAKMAEGLIGALKLSVVNRALGGALGALKAALAVSVVFLVLSYVDLPGESLERESTLYAPVAGVLPQTWDYVSEKFPQVERLSDRFGQRLRTAIPDGMP